MFSGIVRYSGSVVSAQPQSGGIRLSVRCEGVDVERPATGDSIAIDGVCLTATDIDGDVVAFDVIPETLRCSTLGDRAPGDVVNVEYSLRAGDRIGGHFVYGHVDASAPVIARELEGQGERVRIATPVSLQHAIVHKGFVAVDGISLTVAKTGDGWFEVALIPETLSRTTLAQRSRVNLEADPLVRYARA